MRDSLGRCTDVQKKRCTIRYVGSANLCDTGLDFSIQGAPVLVTDIRNAGSQDRAAMNPVQLAQFRKLGKITPDQVEDLAQRSGQDVARLTKLLGPNLD